MSIGLFEKIMDRIFVILWVGIAFLFVWLFFVLIPQAIQRDNRAEEATELGCKYIGHPRDLNTVYFYDCDGEVRMKRVK